MKARGDIPIILCCSEDDEPALAKVVDELLREGMAPELVPGVEFDSNLLSSAVDAAANGALFVLCISPALDKTVARKLTGLFSARSGRGQKIISTAFTPSRPLAILPSIRGALKEMRLTDDDDHVEPQEPERASNLRDVVEAFAEREAPPPASSVAQVDAEALARELAMGMAEAEAILERREQQARASTPPRPTSRRPTPAPVAEPRRPTPAPVTPPRPVSDARREPSVGMVERHLESQLPHVEALVTDGDPSRKIPRSMIPPPPRALADEPQGNRWLLAFAGVGIAGIVVLALLQLFRPGEPEGPRRGAGVGAGVPASAGDGGTRPAGDRKRDDVASDTAAKVDEPAPTTAVPGPPDLVGADEGAAKDDGAAVKDDGTAAKDDGGATPTPAEGGAVEPATTDAAPDDSKDDVPPPPKGATSKRDIEEAALSLAVQEGKLARAGRLFVLRTAGEELTWSEANGRCTGRRINGVGGFHLPSANEIKRVRAARLVASGTWWTRKKAADDEAIAIDAGSGATHVYLTVEPAGRAICVRTL